MKLKVSRSDVPKGNYIAKFVGVEPFQAKDQQYGPGLKWKWQIDQGQHAGQVASRVTGDSPSPKNSCGAILSGLVGKALQADEEIEPDQCVGRSYLIIVAESKNGGTRVESVSPFDVSK